MILIHNSTDERFGNFPGTLDAEMNDYFGLVGSITFSFACTCVIC